MKVDRELAEKILTRLKKLNRSNIGLFTIDKQINQHVKETFDLNMVGSLNSIADKKFSDTINNCILPFKASYENNTEFFDSGLLHIEPKKYFNEIGVAINSKICNRLLFVRRDDVQKLFDELDEHFKPIKEFDLSKAVFSLEEMMMTRKIPLEDKIRNAIIKKRFITQSFNDDLSLILSKYEVRL